jgi:uncharacterized protein
VAQRLAPRDRGSALRGAVAALKVFPLHGVVVLPGTPAPFHVFEPRYKALVGDALRGDRVLAVPSLLRKSDAPAFRPPLRKVCGVGIIEAEERYPDGRYDIVVRGLARVRLVEELSHDKPYREFRAEILEDRLPPRGVAALQDHLEALRQLVVELSTKLPRESGAPELAEAVAQMKDPSAIVDLVTAAAVSDVGARQKVLEELEVARRLEMVIEEVAGVVLVLGKGKGPKV